MQLLFWGEKPITNTRSSMLVLIRTQGAVNWQQITYTSVQKVQALHGFVRAQAFGLSGSLLSNLARCALFCVLNVLQLTNSVTQPSNLLFANHKLCTKHLCQSPLTLEPVALSLQIVFKLRDANCLQGLHAGHTCHGSNVC